MKISNLNLNHSPLWNKWMDYQLTLDNQILTSQKLNIHSINFGVK